MSIESSGMPPSTRASTDAGSSSGKHQGPVDGMAQDQWNAEMINNPFPEPSLAHQPPPQPEPRDMAARETTHLAENYIDSGGPQFDAPQTSSQDQWNSFMFSDSLRYNFDNGTMQVLSERAENGELAWMDIEDVSPEIAQNAYNELRQTIPSAGEAPGSSQNPNQTDPGAPSRPAHLHNAPDWDYWQAAPSELPPGSFQPGPLPEPLMTSPAPQGIEGDAGDQLVGNPFDGIGVATGLPDSNKPIAGLTSGHLASILNKSDDSDLTGQQVIDIINQETGNPPQTSNDSGSDDNTITLDQVIDTINTEMTPEPEIVFSETEDGASVTQIISADGTVDTSHYKDGEFVYHEISNMVTGESEVLIDVENGIYPDNSSQEPADGDAPPIREDAEIALAEEILGPDATDEEIEELLNEIFTRAENPDDEFERLLNELLQNAETPDEEIERLLNELFTRAETPDTEPDQVPMNNGTPDNPGPVINLGEPASDPLPGPVTQQPPALDPLQGLQNSPVTVSEPVRDNETPDNFTPSVNLGPVTQSPPAADPLQGLQNSPVTVSDPEPVVTPTTTTTDNQMNTGATTGTETETETETPSTTNENRPDREPAVTTTTTTDDQMNTGATTGTETKTETEEDDPVADEDE